jgi:hypothetical protein
MQEAQLVIEQLIWLTSLSENILKITAVLMSKMNPNRNYWDSFEKLFI